MYIVYAEYMTGITVLGIYEFLDQAISSIFEYEQVTFPSSMQIVDISPDKDTLIFKGKYTYQIVPIIPNKVYVNDEFDFMF